LFGEGKSFVSYPLRVIYVEQRPRSGVPVAILISVPKKRFKRAVMRNRVKRLVREAYRLNKDVLWELPALSEKGLLIGFVYVSSEFCDFQRMEQAMKKAMATLSSVLC
jgi:ribonuclease P protein component